MPQAANHTVVLLGPGDYTMEQCQVAERTAKNVHSNGQQNRSGLPPVPSEAAPWLRSIHTRGEKCLRSVPTHAGTADAGAKMLHQILWQSRPCPAV